MLKRKHKRKLTLLADKVKHQVASMLENTIDKTAELVDKVDRKIDEWLSYYY